MCDNSNTSEPCIDIFLLSIEAWVSGLLTLDVGKIGSRVVPARGAGSTRIVGSRCFSHEDYISVLYGSSAAIDGDQ